MKVSTESNGDGTTRPSNKVHNDLLDDQEWTVQERAIFNGHIDAKATDPNQLSYDLNSQSPTRPGEGSNYSLVEKTLAGEECLLILTLGTTQKDRDIPAVKIESKHALADTTHFLRITCEEAVDREIDVRLPLQADRVNEPIVFKLTGSEDTQLLFRLFEADEATTQPGRLSAKGSTVLSEESHRYGTKRESLYRDRSVRLRHPDDMSLVAILTFSTLTVQPYRGKVPLPEESTEFARDDVEIVGHRGLGQNTSDKTYLQLGENTFESFTSAAKLGASLVEFDVQLTRDLVPIIYHDYSLSETGTDVPIHDLTFDQFMYAGNIQSARHKSTSFPVESVGQTPNTDRSRRQRLSLSSAGDIGADVQDRIRHTVAFTNKGFKGNTRGSYVQDSFTTLEDLLVRLPPDLGFDIELKYPRPFEAAAANLAPIALEVNTFVDAVLEKIARHANGRRIVLSSFTPEVCISLALKQRAYPVMFITNAGQPPMLDREKRAESMKVGVQFARRWGLAGIVFHVGVLLAAPKLVQYVKDQGLTCASYGLDNNVPDNAKLQAEAGIDMIIADRVGIVAKALKGARGS